MVLVSPDKLKTLKKALQKHAPQKRRYCIMTFGCQMNQADSEKIHMLLLQAGLAKVDSWEEADIVIFNTCSVRQKGEDRVFSYMEDIAQFCRKNGRDIKISITGCMTRKTGINKKYYEYTGRKNATRIQHLNILENEKILSHVVQDSHHVTAPLKRSLGVKAPFLKGGVPPKAGRGDLGKNQSSAPPTAGQLLQKGAYKESTLFNSDDALFIRTDSIDFIVRIEEIGALTTILSIIYNEDIGQDDAFQQYLNIAQARENPASASVIIQTGCDNYCTFCIVPYTRGKEVSRSMAEIIEECSEAVRTGAKEITLLGQNVNSYGKELQKNMWDEEGGKWKNIPLPSEGVPTLSLSKGGGVGEYSPSSGRGVPTNRNRAGIPLPSEGVSASADGVGCFIEGIEISPGKVSYQTLPHNQGLKEKARILRKAGNLPEVVFWNMVKQKQFFGLDFDRQKIIGNYIVDFYCDYLGLAIEIDGSSHDEKAEHDSQRDVFLQSLGVRVAHIPVYEIMHNKEGVFEYVKNFILENYGPTPSSASQNPPLPRRGILAPSSALVESTPSIKGNTYPVSALGGSTPSSGRGIVTPFRDLLNQLNTIECLDRIRFTSSNPHDMTRDILDAHFDLEKCCHFLHFALQSGDNEILKSMNRKHTYEQFRDMVQYLRSRDPLFGISTDIIVGFPGETEEQFENTVQAFRECQFDFAYIARYSPRKLTYAAKMPNQVPADIKAKRWDKLNSLMYEIIQVRNQLMLGREEVILVSNIDTENGTISGRTRNFKEVFVPKNPRIKLGDLVPVKITEMDRWVLRGKEIE